MPDKTIIAIDPGQTGAICVRYPDGKLVTEKMPDTMADIWDLVTSFVFSWLPPAEAIIENVGGYVPGNAGPGSVKFARHVGHLEMALYAAGIPTTKVSPSVWMKALGVPPKMEKGDRKRFIKDLMQRRYPKIKVTLVNADCLGILEWGLKQ